MKIRTKKTVDFANQWVKDDLIVRLNSTISLKAYKTLNC